MRRMKMRQMTASIMAAVIAANSSMAGITARGSDLIILEESAENEADQGDVIIDEISNDDLDLSEQIISEETEKMPEDSLGNSADSERAADREELIEEEENTAGNTALDEEASGMELFAEEPSAQTDTEEIQLISGLHIPADAATFNGHSYYVYSIGNFYEEAEAYCQSLGGHLATISSGEENQFLYDYLVSLGLRDAFFGYTDREAEGTWKWVTDEQITFTNWAQGEPNSQGVEDNAMFYRKFTRGEWNDGHFRSGDSFICEWDGLREGISPTDFQIEKGILTGYFGTETHVVVPDMVTEIGSRAFFNNTTVQTVTMPEGLVRIGESAFSGCTALSTIRFPESVEEIGASAFAYCSGLKGNLILPPGIRKIEDSCFRSCGGLSGDLVIPSGVTRIEANAFEGCTGFDGQLLLPSGLRFIGERAFRECPGFTGTLELPEGIEAIAAHTFEGCRGFTGTLRIPDTVRIIDQRAFRECAGLTSVVMGKGMSHIVVYEHSWMAPCFQNCDNLETMTFLGEEVPQINGNMSVAGTEETAVRRFFEAIPNLRTIYALPSALETYQSAWGAYLPSGVYLSSDVSRLPIANLKVSSAASGSVLLSWDAFEGGPVAGYRVYRDGVHLADVTGTTFADTGLAPETTYQYAVQGYTEDGQQTEEAAVSATTCLPKVLSIYTGSGADRVGISDAVLCALTADPGNAEGASGRFSYIDRDGKEIQIGDELTGRSSKSDKGSVYQTVWDIAGIEEGRYSVRFSYTDRDGKTDTYETDIRVDRSRPEPITRLVAWGGRNQIVLSWSLAHEIDTKIYRIYRKAEKEGSFRHLRTIRSHDIVSFTDINVETGKKYSYYITAVDPFHQESDPSETADAIAEADTAPPRIVSLKPASGTIAGQTVHLSAQAVDDASSVIAMELALSEDDGQHWMSVLKSASGSISGTLDLRDIPGTEVRIKVLAWDGAGNVSEERTAVYPIDREGPAKVEGLKAIGTQTTVTLSWHDVPEQDFSFFRVERKTDDGSYEKVADVANTLGLNVRDLPPDTDVTFRVTAYDRWGNRGEASEDVIVHTLKDTEGPVVTSMSPKPGYVKDTIRFQADLSDESPISKVVVQTSPNGYIWKDAYEQILSEPKKALTVSQDIDISDFPEGSIFVRAIGTDIDGNRGDESENAPYTEYRLDVTSPESPSGLAVTDELGAPVIAWAQGPEEDIEDYQLYRAVKGKEDEFRLIAGNIHRLNYTDRTAKPGETYLYWLTVTDQAGNVSDPSVQAEGSRKEDRQEPEILNARIEGGDRIGPSSHRLRLLVRDDDQLENVEIIVRSENEDAGRILLRRSGIADYYAEFSVSVPIEKAEDGQKLVIGVTASDRSGNKAARPSVLICTVDRKAPAVSAVTASGDKTHIEIQWKGGGEEDLSGYRIYRKTDSSAYELIGSRSAGSVMAGTEAQYTWSDNMAEASKLYRYKVEAVDRCGNVSSAESGQSWLMTEPTVEAKLRVPNVLQAGTEYRFDLSGSRADLGIAAVHLDFGDGTSWDSAESAPGRNDIILSAVHKYADVGTYTVKLTVTDREGNEQSYAQAQKEESGLQVFVTEPRLLGQVRVRAEDADGNILQGMPVYFGLADQHVQIRATDSQGYASFMAEAGAYRIGAYDEGYLPAERTALVHAGENHDITLTLEKREMVTGTFEVTRMALDEIAAAGIDVHDPANQEVFRINLHLTYGAEEVPMALITNGMQVLQGGTRIVDTPEGKRQLTAQIAEIQAPSSKPDLSVIAVMDVPVEASFLKEFFNVQLHIFNQSDDRYRLENNTVTLNMPNGLTIPEGIEGALNGQNVNLPDIGGQESQTVEWILRGDREGDYELGADYSGVLSDFHVPVTAHFQTEEPIHVYGSSGVKLIADIDTNLTYGGMYFNLSMQNNRSTDISLPSLDVAGGVIDVFERKEGIDEKAQPEFIEDEKYVRNIDNYLTDPEGQILWQRNGDAPACLPAGSTYTRKYVAYNCMTSADYAYLLDALAQVQRDYGLEIVINQVYLNHFDTSDADAKAESMAKDHDKQSMYEFLADSDNFYYYRQAEDDDTLMSLLEHGTYRYLKMVESYDLGQIFGNGEVRGMTRKLIAELLKDEGCQTATQMLIDTRYEQAVDEVIEAFLSMLEVPSSAVDTGSPSVFSKEEGDRLKAYYHSADQAARLAAVLRAKGGRGLIEKLKKDLPRETARLTGDIIEERIDDNELLMAVSSGLSDELGNISRLLGEVQNVNRAWIESAELTDQLITISASKEEAEKLFDMILDCDVLKANATYGFYDEIAALKGKMESGFDDQMTAFAKELAAETASAGIHAGLTTLTRKVFGSGGEITPVSMLFSIYKIIFHTLDQSMGWENTDNMKMDIRAIAMLTVGLEISMRKNRAAGNTREFLVSLKYLIKMRLIGEKAYINMVKEYKDVKGDDQQDHALERINREQGTAYGALDDYYLALREKVLSYRDTLYQTHPQPAASVPGDGDDENLGETTRLGVRSMWPAKAAKNIPIECRPGEMDLKLCFAKDVKAIRGTITVVNRTTGTEQKINAVTGTQISGRELTIHAAPLAYGGKYYVLIEPGSFSVGDSVFTGLQDKSDWNFETMEGGEAGDGADHFSDGAAGIIAESISTVYNPRLAHLLADFSQDAYHEQQIKTSLQSMGFSDICTYHYGSGSGGTVAYAFGRLRLPDGKMAVMTVIRGSSGVDEWISNLVKFYTDAQMNNAHSGFADAANAVYGSLKEYTSRYPEENVYLVTGHSRGAAAADLLEYMLLQSGVSPSRVYGYNFACPDVARNFASAEEMFLGYENIFNLAEIHDPVPMVPGSLLDLVTLKERQDGKRWGKYGIYMQYSRRENGGKVIDVDEHQMSNYLSYLRDEKPFSQYTLSRTDPLDAFADSVRFIVHCPVDIVVKDHNRKPIAAVIGNEPCYYDSAFGDVVILVDGEEKLIFVRDGDGVTASLEGTDSGTMDMEVTVGPAREPKTDKTWKGVPLFCGKKMACLLNDLEDAENENDIESGAPRLYVLDERGDKTAEIQPDGGESKLRSQQQSDSESENRSGQKEGESSPSAEPGSPITGAGHVHSFGDEKVTSEATVWKTGTVVSTCAICGKTQTRIIPKQNPLIRLNTYRIPLKTGQSTTAVKVTEMGRGDYIVSWTSSNRKVASVSKRGKIRAGKKTGKAVITVRLASGISASVSVKVQKQKVKAKKIMNLPKSVTLRKGQKFTLAPLVQPVTVTDKMRFSSSKKRIARISRKGVITAVSPGKAILYVKCGGKICKIKVSVK